MRSQLLGLAVALVLALVLGGLPAPASAAPGATIQSITLNGCFIDVTFQVQDAGSYYVNLWDDGNFRAGAGGAVPANGTMTVRYVIGDPILEGAPGIGIYVENGLGIAATTTYDADGNYAVSAAVGDPCAAANATSASVLNVTGVAGCDVLMPIPPQAVVGTFVAPAEVYYAPGKLTSPLITLPAGKSAWVFGMDASGEYYKFMWNCQTLWVKVGTIGPNFDATWQGRPLPTTVVS
ncbi:MAG: hypothetical protein AAGU78_12815 [Chloroflexota bacterium]